MKVLEKAYSKLSNVLHIFDKSLYPVMKNSSLGIILIYNLVTVILIIVFYPLIPILMSYPPNNEEVSRALGTSNSLQYIIIMSFTIIVSTLIFIRAFKGINGWRDLSRDNPDDIRKIHKIREKCINLPYLISFGQMFIIIVFLIPIGLLVTTLNDSSRIVVLKVTIMVFSMFSLAAVISHTFARKFFTQILLKTYIGDKKEGFRFKLGNKIFFHIIPMIVVGILFTALIGYSRIIEEKGDLIYKIYKAHLEERFKNGDDIINSEYVFTSLESISLKDYKTIFFVKTPEGNIVTSDNSVLGGYFTYYIDNPYAGNRMFDLNAETQGVIKKVKSKTGEWSIGIIFNIASEKTIMFFVFGFLSLLILNIFVLYYFSKSLAGEISLVAESLNEIAEGEQVDLDRKLAVVSNDELADLVIAFNKIQEREKEHIKEIEENHAILIAHERLATLGHLIGGIAHNLRTPIMSVSGAIEGLKDLIKEYDESIDDNNVTKEDHHEIAKEMSVWIEKMRPYCAYMSDIITVVKGQAMQRSSESGIDFTLDELNKRIEILFEYELKKQHCKLNTVYNVDMNTKINGDISDLVQILNNLILNAVDSYEDRGGKIELTVNGSEGVVEFIIRDYGKGMPNDVQERLFKEMITTKGKNGTGLGLYMSYSNVKAKFGGKIRFESEEGKGTTFYVYIPTM